MARKLRLLFPGASYHVINRGNYRHDVFNSPGAATAFEATLFEAARRCGWQMHAFVVMRNHYHLAITTPEPNLADGMQWLQATFATRFNRFRQQNGHLFQGRYKALLVEPGETMARLVDYIHLNPVRAHVVPAEEVARHRWSSLRHFLGFESRSPVLEAQSWLHVFGQPDDGSAWPWYLKRLVRLGGDPDLQRREGLVDLSSGWALGTGGWRKAIAEEHSQRALDPGLAAREVRELRERRWAHALEQALRKRGKQTRDIMTDRKGASWKVEVALELRRSALASNGWIAEQLRMGHPRAVSSCISQQLRRSNMTYET